MEPTKDNFMVSYIGIHDSRDNEKLKEQIFKSQEIVERMKKLDLKKKIDEAYFNCNRDHPETREILANLSNDIQKILGEKK